MEQQLVVCVFVCVNGFCCLRPPATTTIHQTTNLSLHSSNRISTHQPQHPSPPTHSTADSAQKATIGIRSVGTGRRRWCDSADFYSCLQMG